MSTPSQTRFNIPEGAYAPLWLSGDYYCMPIEKMPPDDQVRARRALAEGQRIIEADRARRAAAEGKPAR